ncbi:MAG: HAMP domain-containing histidine kinase [Desulfuromonadales bacterium]|nr:HAMP domain-containing histidine kinase [Desulfuromonadales bacterium]
MNNSAKRKVVTRAIPPARGETNETTLERMERYTNHLESLILRKNEEMHSMQRIMALRVEEEIQKVKLNERVMIHQARQAAMGELLGVIAHQWRQPLNVIALIVQNMKETWEAAEFDSSFLDHSISRAMEQICLLSRSIDDFRGFLKPAAHSEHFDPKQCLKEILALITSWFSNFTTYEIRITDETEGGVRVAGCQNAFQQVILNLLRNADDAIQEQSRRIGRSFRGAVEIRFRRTDDLIVSIANNGVSIDESALESIFNPYFTTKNRNNGFGIGLYLSRIIIESNMNGSIWAEYIPDGALFGIRLPAMPMERSRK